MAIIPMQKVAIMTLKSLKEDVLHLLHDEGVLEVSDVRDTPGTVDHSEVKFRKAELEFAIANLLPFASKKIRAAMDKKPSKDDVIMAALHTDIRGIIDSVHALEKKEHDARKAIHEHKKGVDSVGGGSVNEAAYFTGSVPHAQIKAADAPGGVSVDPAVQAELVRLEQSLEDVHHSRMRLAAGLTNLSRALVYLRWLDDKQAVREAMRETDSTVTLFGWVAKKHMPRLEKKLHDLSEATAILKVKPDENETMPVQLKNPKFLTPFESVTKLYGLPQSSEMDPTPFLSLFFILFFALCLTDAGYGLVQAAIMGGYLLYIRKNVEEAPLIWLLFLSGVVTFFVSIPFGGWFGMTPQMAPSFLTETRADGVMWFKGQIWNLGETEGITFLQNLSLALGIIHLSFGVALSAYWKALQGKFAAAFWQDVSTLSMIGSLLFWGFAPTDLKQIAVYSIYGAVAFMIWGKGYGSPALKRPLFGILQTLNWFLGMMGNVLSYLRILALGLVTGALAFTVNLVAEQIGALLPWFVAIPFMIIVYVVGHFMNIVLNVLGAFIHSGRLQFVEFFSQFFEGGGRPFRPFTRAS